MKISDADVAVAIAQWWYVEWSPLGAFRAVKVDEAHYRNFCAMKDRTPAGYEPVGLFPDLSSALSHIRELKRMRKEQSDDAGAVSGGDGVVESGADHGGAEHEGV